MFLGYFRNRIGVFHEYSVAQSNIHIHTKSIMKGTQIYNRYEEYELML